ncbi:glycosyltransferase family 8 protein [Clostridium vitabionis]|uniref:glycosyltransferase family 8 protein n=1 Tax=Clostridium vitabionis TaxID=2784388 RepID=UPI00188B0597|nr:glycosyltransferase family 8 protein [Clostridium vitabionis]
MISKTKEIFYACDGNYLTQTLVSAETLLRHNPDAQITIAGDHFTKEDQARVYRQFQVWHKDIRLIDLNGFFPDAAFQTDAFHARSIYAKLFIDQIYAGGRVLYLDSDTVICGKLDKLFSMNLGECIAAAVKMPYPEEFRKRMGLPAEIPYFCDGVVLFDIDRWREDGCSRKSLQLIRKNKGNPPGQSEGVLNAILSGRIRALPPEYNLMSGLIYYSADQMARLYGCWDYYPEDDRKKALKHPIIVHYLRELYNRPWFLPCDHPYRKIYWRANAELLEPGKRKWRFLPAHTIATRVLRRIFPFDLFCHAFQYRHRWRK